MNTPICDFVKKYADSQPVRLHMPGHKGLDVLGFEKFDITEIDGADELFSADGIIAESEKNASEIFGCRTVYSAGGSTLCIQAMLYLLMQNAPKGEKPCILAGRNAHKAFVNASALLDIDIEWIYPAPEESYLRCSVTPRELEKRLNECDRQPCAVYLTSPDYLGNILDIQGLAAVCRRVGVPLAVDNAHGAYLKFLPKSLHPIDLGADICCDSAHKTLPVITGGAYLHISDSAPASFSQNAKTALSIFASSSPSYLILQSLDAMNARASEFSTALREFLPLVHELKEKIKSNGFHLIGDEPLKITILPKNLGYTGDELSEVLQKSGIYSEFHDPDALVLMLSPFCKNDLKKLSSTLLSLEKKTPIFISPPCVPRPKRAISPRTALLSASKTVPAASSLGRISAAAAVSCPPAIPLVTSGEIIDEDALKCFEYYGIEQNRVVK